MHSTADRPPCPLVTKGGGGGGAEAVLQSRHVEATFINTRIDAATNGCSWLLVFRPSCYRQSG